MTSAAIVSLRVAASPERAFRAFTEEIGAWWRPNTLFQLTPRGDGALFFEPGPLGRLATRLPNGKVFEIGRVIVWRPGEKLVFSWRPASFSPEQSTEVEVTFEAIGGSAGEETRVTVEHRGWDRIPAPHVARHGMELMFFQRKLAAFWLAGLGSIAARLSPGAAPA